MTGYGRGKLDNEQREITAEVRSVNHRYLDITVKAPKVYGFLEDPVKKAAAAAISRGKVDIYISVREKDGGNIEITPNLPVIEGYLSALEQIGGAYPARLKKEAVSAVELFALPDVLNVDKKEVEESVLVSQVLDALSQALSMHSEMRSQEGKHLCEDIGYRGRLIGQMVGQIELRSPDCVSEYRERLSARMTELLDGSDFAQQRILTEAAIYADKISVTEEIVRLKSHLQQLSKMLEAKSAVGRKLDFLVQELNREANTIGSKANDFAIASHVVDMKAEIEKIREQVQNLE